MSQQSFDCRRCPKRRRLFDVARLDNQRGFRHFRRMPKCPHEHAPLQKSDFRTSPVTELACGQCAQAVRGFTAAMSLGRRAAQKARQGVAEARTSLTFAPRTGSEGPSRWRCWWLRVAAGPKSEWMPAARYRVGSSHAPTYTDPAQAISVCFFSLFSTRVICGWCARREQKPRRMYA